MLSVLPLRLIARILGFAYIAVVIGFAYLLKPNMSEWSLSHIGTIASSALGAFILGVPLIASLAWRFLWRRVPYLQSLYPDISGEWDVTIQWSRAGNHGSVLGKAIVRQDLLRISMELEAPDSDSRTLSAVPKKDPESGRASLHYMYLVIPHAKPRSLGVCRGAPQAVRRTAARSGGRLVSAGGRGRDQSALPAE